MQMITIATLLVLTAIGYTLGRQRAVATVGGRRRELHSLPSYHGLHVALWCALPSLVLVLLWVILEPHILQALIIANLPPELAAKPANELGLILNDIQNIANSGATAGADPVEAGIAARLITWRQASAIALIAAEIRKGRWWSGGGITKRSGCLTNARRSEPVPEFCTGR